MMKVTAKAIMFSVILGSSLLMGCANQAVEPEVVQACSAPGSVRLERAIGEARSTLSRPDCARHFDSYFQKLLSVGEGDPDAANRAAFRDFISWSHEQGLIGKLQGKTLYTRYFHRNFVSLPDEYNNCAASCPVLEDLERDLRNELVDKHRGIVNVLGDQDAYSAIDSDYNGTLLLLDAACQSCADARED